MQSKSTQLLLEALTCGTATAVAKRNNPTVLLIMLIMIALFFSIFISDANYYNLPWSVALSHTLFCISFYRHTSRSYLVQYGYSGFTKPSSSQRSPTVLQNAVLFVIRQYHSSIKSCIYPRNIQGAVVED